MAKLAGLDATAFNKSKRVSRDGRLRWPSTESLARALAAVDEQFSDFARLVEGEPSVTIPMIDFSLASAANNFDSTGHPSGHGWESLHFHHLELLKGTYVLEVSDDCLEPLYKCGDRLIVSPTAQVQSWDWVVAMNGHAEVGIYQVSRTMDQSVVLNAISAENAAQVIPNTDLAWIARILWVCPSPI
ncbi:MAG: S24 family peptidase [Pseudomonadota bacterium]